MYKSIRRSVMVLASLFIGALSLVRVEGQIPVLDDAQKAEVVESLLDLENEAQRSEFVNIKGISSVNMKSLSPSVISKLGFSLIEAREIDRLKTDHVVDYLLVKSINYFEGGRIVVKLARVSEGRPCFGPPFSRQESFTYEFKREVQDGTERWVGRLISKSLPFWLGKSLTGQR